MSPMTMKASLTPFPAFFLSSINIFLLYVYLGCWAFWAWESLVMFLIQPRSLPALTTGSSSAPDTKNLLLTVQWLLWPGVQTNTRGASNHQLATQLTQAELNSSYSGSNYKSLQKTESWGKTRKQFPHKIWFSFTKICDNCWCTECHLSVLQGFIPVPPSYIEQTLAIGSQSDRKRHS